VKGVVTEVDARGAQVELEGGILGQLRASELSRDRVEDARTVLKPGDEIEARFTGLDRKTRVLTLSIKAKEAHEEAQAVESYKADSAATGAGTSLGDLLKEQISNNSDA
jgi:small subunit ribosomal protein S1